MKKFKNLTKHNVVYQTPSGERLIIPPSGLIAEVDTMSQPALELETELGPVFFGPAQLFGEVYTFQKVGEEIVKLPFPSKEEGVVLIVGMIVADQLKGRDTDVCSPGTGPKDGPIRYADGPQKGQVEAVKRFNWAPKL